MGFSWEKDAFWPMWPSLQRLKRLKGWQYWLLKSLISAKAKKCQQCWANVRYCNKQSVQLLWFTANTHHLRTTWCNIHWAYYSVRFMNHKRCPQFPNGNHISQLEPGKTTNCEPNVGFRSIPNIRFDLFFSNIHTEKWQVRSTPNILISPFKHPQWSWLGLNLRVNPAASANRHRGLQPVQTVDPAASSDLCKRTLEFLLLERSIHKDFQSCIT